MCKESIGRCDIAHAEGVQLRIVPTTSCINGQQNGPGDEASNKTDGTDDSEKAQEQIAIQRRVVKNVGIRDPKEISHPIDPA